MIKVKKFLLHYSYVCNLLFIYKFLIDLKIIGICEDNVLATTFKIRVDVPA